MIRTVCIGGASALALLGVAATPALAVDVTLEEVATGLTAPLAMAQPEGDDRIFIIEQPGMIKILQNGELLDEPFLDIRHKIVDLHHEFDERGLLGLAFHPDFANNVLHRLLGPAGLAGRPRSEVLVVAHQHGLRVHRVR